MLLNLALVYSSHGWKTIANGTTSTGHTYSSELLLIADLVQQPDGEYKIKMLKEFVDAGMIMSGFFAEELKRVEEASRKEV